MKTRLAFVAAFSFFASVLAGCGSSTPSTSQAPGLTPPGAAPSDAAQASCFGAPPTHAAIDDWVTHAHDFHRTGCQAQSTGISSSTVSNLKLKWKVNLGDAFYAGPLAYDGSVFVFSYTNGTVAALASKNGHVWWKRQLGVPNVGIIMTPTYDKGMLFVATHGILNSNFAIPGTLYALNAKTGATIWQEQFAGPVRSSPAVAGGRLFVGVAGGDPPQCIQGGLFALNEYTGQVIWSYYVNTLPHDGGSVWGPITYDAGRLIFGTGNTCDIHAVPLRANGVVALDLSGKQLWQTGTLSIEDGLVSPGTDDDIASGSTLVNGTLVNLSKNAHVYYTDELTGAVLHKVSFPVTDQYAGFSTAVTDGSTLVVTTNSETTSASQVHGRIETATRATSQGAVTYSGNGTVLAYDFSGNLKWNVFEKNAYFTTGAVTKDVVFLDYGYAVNALNINTGAKLWSYSFGTNSTISSPIVVPSGVYATDLGGNVYGFGF